MNAGVQQFGSDSHGSTKGSLPELCHADLPVRRPKVRARHQPANGAAARSRGALFTLLAITNEVIEWVRQPLLRSSR
jgi:hypothetical protein